MKRIRPIEGRDRESIHQLLISTGAFQPHELTVALGLIDEAASKPGPDHYLGYVLEQAGELVAYACFGRNPMTSATYDLYWLATRQDQMRQGHGRHLVQFVEEEIKRYGGRLLVIETSSKASYAGSREFYLRVGYQLAGSIPDFYELGDDRVIYYRRLDRSATTSRP